jgi:3-keto-L-gulonate-6-phosphate decarboxylase
MICLIEFSACSFSAPNKSTVINTATKKAKKRKINTFGDMYGKKTLASNSSGTNGIAMIILVIQFFIQILYVKKHKTKTLSGFWKYTFNYIYF